MFALIVTALVLRAPSTPMRILFLGNSHTYVNNVPQAVKYLLESDGTGRKVEIESRFGAFLNDIAKDERVRRLVTSGAWNVVVLQGALVSSSHKYVYSNDGAVQLAKLAKNAGARVLLYVEWPRRGWDESEYQLSIYKTIANAAKVESVPVCFAWDNFRRQHPNVEMWSEDGNHASAYGSFLAACTFYYWIAKSPTIVPTWRPNFMDPGTANGMKNAAANTFRAHARSA